MVRGLTSGEGCFFIGIKAINSSSLGYQVYLKFKLSQYSIDEQLIRSLIEYLNCGNVYKDRESFVFKVYKFQDIVNKIIPFYQENKVVGVKEKNFADLIKVA